MTLDLSLVPRHFTTSSNLVSFQSFWVTGPAPASLVPSRARNLHSARKYVWSPDPDLLALHAHRMVGVNFFGMNTVTNRNTIRAIARYLAATVGREEARLQVPFALAVCHTFQKTLHTRLSGKNL